MKKRIKRNVFIASLILLLIFFSIMIYFIKVVNPVIKSYTKAKINALTEQALNLAVSNVINTTLNYDSIVNVSYTTTGEISYVSANQYSINSITREVIKNAQQQMLTLGEEGVKVPLGSFSGISLFNGRGPKVKLQMVPIGIVSSQFKSHFNAVGINNTLHQLYLDVIIKVKLILPLKNVEIKTTQSILLCEGIIIGKVPEVYFGGKDLIKNFDLVP